MHIDKSQFIGLEKPQAGVGGGDEKTIVQAHADVASTRMHIAAIKQALAYAAYIFANRGVVCREVHGGN